jgi:hypothetical protein
MKLPRTSHGQADPNRLGVVLVRRDLAVENLFLKSHPNRNNQLTNLV